MHVYLMLLVIAPSLARGSPNFEEKKKKEKTFWILLFYDLIQMEDHCNHKKYS